MPGTTDAVAQLAERLGRLEERVLALEHAPAAQPRLATAQRTSPPPPNLGLRAGGSPQTGVLPTLGRALLGIAGAYVLRAVAESSSAPHAPVIAAAIVYAFAWLLPAWRAAHANVFGATVYAATSAAILVPMLWELSHGYFPDALTAFILGAYAAAALLPGWRLHVQAAATVVISAASVEAVCLGVASHHLVPFLIAVFLIAAVVEFAATRGWKLTARPVLAAALDFGVGLLIFVYSRPEGSRPAWSPASTILLLAAGPALLGIYAAAASTEALILRRRITSFQTGQCLAAAGLALWGMLAFLPGKAELVVGIFCLLAAAAGYGATFLWFDRAGLQRNYHTYATGSLILLLAGSYFCLSPVWTGMLGVAATLAGIRMRRLTLEYHGLACLTVAAFSSGLSTYVLRAATGAFPGPPGWTIILIAACFACCCLWPRSQRGNGWRYELLDFLIAAGAAASVMACLIAGFARAAAIVVTPGVEHIAVARTLAICGIAILLAWAAARLARREAGWVAWLLLVLVAFKLLIEDVPQGHLAFVAASIFVYALTLLLVPRMLRQKSAAN